MIKTENLASNYLFFRISMQYIAVVLPTISAVIAFLMVGNNHEIEIDEQDFMYSQQFEILDNYLSIIKITYVIIIAFFITYRWATMQNDGTYGFWITQGINRNTFLYLITLKLVLYIYFGEMIGLVIIFYFSGIQLEIFSLISIVILVFTTTLMLCSLSLLFGITIRNPEVAAISFLIINVLNFVINSNTSTILHAIFQSDLHYANDSIFSILYSTVLCVVIIMITTFINRSSDIDI